MKITYILLLSILLTACSWPGKKKELRIMPLGDSITAGYTDNPDWTVPFAFGYRSELYRLLDEAGYDFQFVGKSAEPWNGLYGLPTNTPVIDLRKMDQDHHRGYGGWTINRIRNSVAEWIEEDNPDVILLQIGINGIGQESPQQLDTLVNTIFTEDPEVHLIVAQITPYGVYNQALNDYNQYIKNKLVPSKSEEGYNISTTDLYALFIGNPDDPASIVKGSHSNPPHNNHPSQTFYDKMAVSWFEAISEEYELLMK